MVIWLWVGWNRATETACIFKQTKKQTKPKVKNETGLLSHLWGGQEGMKSQAAYNKHISLGLFILRLLFWGDKQLSLFCSLWILSRNFWHLLILNFSPQDSEYVQPKSCLNSTWSGLQACGGPVPQKMVSLSDTKQQDFKWLLNRDEYVFASFHLPPRVAIEYLCHPFVLPQEPDSPRLLQGKTSYF